MFLSPSTCFPKTGVNDQFKYSPVLIDIPENAATMRASSPKGEGRNTVPSQVNKWFRNIYRISTKVVVMGPLRRIMRFPDQQIGTELQAVIQGFLPKGS